MKHPISTTNFIFIEEGINICINDKHPEKAEYLIEFTEEGIAICFNDEQPLNEFFLIEVTEKEISNVICVNDVAS